jgi:enoyl-[acyl-carrier-protein] reductase (NADH)
MTLEIPRPVLKGSKALVVGIANEHSIAYGCAKAFRELGALLLGCESQADRDAGHGAQSHQIVQ